MTIASDVVPDDVIVSMSVAKIEGLFSHETRQKNSVDIEAQAGVV